MSMIGKVQIVKDPVERMKNAARWYNWIVYTMRQIPLPAGIKRNDDAANYMAALATHESGLFTSRVARENNNFSGIKWINKPYQHATQGIQALDGGYFAKFATPEDWLKDLLRILVKKPAVPYYATNLKDFVHRMKVNKYFPGSEAAYYSAASKYLKQFGQLAEQNNNALVIDQNKRANQAIQQQAKQVPADGVWDNLKTWYGDHKMWVIVAGVIGGVVLIKSATR